MEFFAVELGSASYFEVSVAQQYPSLGREYSGMRVAGGLTAGAFTPSKIT
jgi:hypothetical protein